MAIAGPSMPTRVARGRVRVPASWCSSAWPMPWRTGIPFAVIRGAAINNDGAGKAGYTAPCVDGQVEAIATAQMIAGVEPRSIGYVEAHGTATPLGDPIEIAALRQVFQAGTSDRGFCR